MDLKIGDVVTLAVAVLGNSTGTRGIVYDTYTDFDDDTKCGAGIIFENGEFDGFSFDDQDIFLNLENVRYIPFYMRDYKFTNVMKLSQDFKKGFWDEIFN